MNVLADVAGECQMKAQLEEATELFMAAEQPGRALRIINHRLSDVIEEVGKGECGTSAQSI